MRWSRTRVAGEIGGLDKEQLRRLQAGPDGSAPPAVALLEGWLLKLDSGDEWWDRLFRQGNDAGVRVWVRLTADALALYADAPGAPSKKGNVPTDVLFLSSVSSVTGRGENVIRLNHIRGVDWKFVDVDDDDDNIREWTKAIAGRMGHFRKAKRVSQRVTRSRVVQLKDPQKLKSLSNKKCRNFLRNYSPCFESCLGPARSPAAFALTRRLSVLKEPTPYRGDIEFHSENVDAKRLAVVSDPELQEAQVAHWSDQAVRYLKLCLVVPEELVQDFVLTLRMGAPDGLKRLIWPLAVGEAVVPPKIDGGLPGGMVYRDPAPIYDSLLSRAFGGVRPDTLEDPVPTFCQGIQGLEDESPPLKAVVKHLHLLTAEGENALRRLLWVIQLTCHQIEFCPFLPNLLATLLTFFNEAEVMMMVSTILREAEAIPQSHEKNRFPRIVWNSSQMNKQAKVFVREGKRKPRTALVIDHLEELGFDLHALGVELMQDGLATRLPFRALCRVVGSFLREGSEVIMRYALALIKLRSQQIVDCKTKEDAKKELDTMGGEYSTFSSIDRLSKAAFSRIIEDASVARVNSFWGSAYVTPKTGGNRKHMFCRPRLFPPRGKVPDVVWEALWPWIPTSCRIFDPHLIYTPSSHGTSMRTCLEVCRKHPEAPMFFFIYTEDGDIIGGYSPCVWLRTHGYVNHRDLRRPAETAFVFRKLSSSVTEVWPWMGANEMLFDASELHGLSFGGQNAAVAISKDMQRATTSASATFGSPILLSPPGLTLGGDLPSKQISSASVEGSGEYADFEMLAFEVFALL